MDTRYQALSEALVILRDLLELALAVEAEVAMPTAQEALEVAIVRVEALRDHRTV